MKKFNEKEYINEYNKKKYKCFNTRILPEEAKKIDKILRDRGMSKASFVRWGIEELEKQNNLEQSKIK